MRSVHPGEGVQGNAVCTVSPHVLMPGLPLGTVRPGTPLLPGSPGVGAVEAPQERALEAREGEPGALGGVCLVPCSP